MPLSLWHFITAPLLITTPLHIAVLSLHLRISSVRVTATLTVQLFAVSVTTALPLYSGVRLFVQNAVALLLMLFTGIPEVVLAMPRVLPPKARSRTTRRVAMLSA